MKEFKESQQLRFTIPQSYFYRKLNVNNGWGRFCRFWFTGPFLNL